MKTISELNERWWYRLLKVMYVGLGIVFCLVAFAFIYDAYTTIEINKDRFANEQIRNIEQKKLNEEKDKEIERMKLQGYSTTEISDTLKSKYSASGELLTLTRNQYDAIYGEYPNAPVGNSKTEERDKPESPGTLLWLFLIAPMTMLTVWFSLEVVRRTIYYIVLGSLRPKKE